MIFWLTLVEVEPDLTDILYYNLKKQFAGKFRFQIMAANVERRINTVGYDRLSVKSGVR